MKYKIIRSKRKTMGIYVNEDGNFEVRCPEKVPAKTIDEFVLSRQDWINETVALMKEHAQLREKFQLKPGSKLRLLGKLYPLAEVQRDKMGFDGKYFYIPLSMHRDDIKPNLIRLYQRIAEDILKSKVIEFSKWMNVKPTNVKISSAKTRWGSCSGKNSINFSWKLILADEQAVNYVVIHELAHTIEHNHSEKFWSIVENYMPDYENQKKVLKQLGKELSVEDWD